MIEDLKDGAKTERGGTRVSFQNAQPVSFEQNSAHWSTPSDKILRNQNEFGKMVNKSTRALMLVPTRQDEIKTNNLKPIMENAENSNNNSFVNSVDKYFEDTTKDYSEVVFPRRGWIILISFLDIKDIAFKIANLNHSVRKLTESLNCTLFETFLKSYGLSRKIM